MTAQQPIFDTYFGGGPLDGEKRRIIVQPHDLTVWRHRHSRTIVEIGGDRQADLWEPHHYALIDGDDENWSRYAYVGPQLGHRESPQSPVPMDTEV